jgi:hypothetical protein
VVHEMATVFANPAVDASDCFDFIINAYEQVKE